jgi:hypothetical protein
LLGPAHAGFATDDSVATNDPTAARQGGGSEVFVKLRSGETPADPPINCRLNRPPRSARRRRREAPCQERKILRRAVVRMPSLSTATPRTTRTLAAAARQLSDGFLRSENRNRRRIIPRLNRQRGSRPPTARKPPIPEKTTPETEHKKQYRKDRNLPLYCCDRAATCSNARRRRPIFVRLRTSGNHEFSAVTVATPARALRPIIAVVTATVGATRPEHPCRGASAFCIEGRAYPRLTRVASSSLDKTFRTRS